MALNRQRAQSEKLWPASGRVYGTVISREQLRHRLSERQSMERRVDGPSQAPNTEDADNSYAAVCKKVWKEKGEGGSLDTHVSLYEDENGKVQGVVELSTLRQRRVPHIKVRVICLIDVSGSMLLKGDRKQRRSKISILKNMAVDVIDALENEEDFFGVMTFGEKSKVLCPLDRVSAATRVHVKTVLSDLDKTSGFSTVTDLSSALLDTISMLTSAQREEGLLYRNCIIVFSDGEVNAGHTDPQKLVHVTREKIRECGMTSDLLADLWVNVSCVTTGGGFSQCLYLLSKLCGSDAYYYVDGSKDFPETDMLIPLMLRKKACAQMVSLTIRTSNGAKLETHKCSQEYSVRRCRGRNVDQGSMVYFLHDMPSATSKTFQVSLDLRNMTTQDKAFLMVDTQYVDALGFIHNISTSLHRHQLLTLTSDRTRTLQVMAKTEKCRMRSVLQNTCRQVAYLLEEESQPDCPKNAREELSQAAQAGLAEVKQVCGEVLTHFCDDDDEERAMKEEVKQFAGAIIANLSKLRSLVSVQARGPCWQFTKALASAVGREQPTVADVVVQSPLLCPLPREQDCDSRRTQALSIYVMGETGWGEGEGNILHNAARDVARSLADVLKDVEAAYV